MAFDQKTRNLLQRTVTACRRVLDREFTAQLQELYGIQPDGALSPLSELDHLADEQLEIAGLLRSRINHLEGGEPAEGLTRTQAKPEHVSRVIREQAFTVLNRLAALRLCEERGLVLECVRQGVNSEGFQLFMTTAGNALGETHEAYRIYLHCLFDELALDLGVLFDRFSPLALLFPRKDALEEVLRELNGSGKAAETEAISAEQFAELWKADEAIGWIYQYYNDEAERKKMRKVSSAPRNSRELAVRNQFFTPRYVVEFLTDNTLGRLWYEMTRGATILRDRCRYLVRRPTEIFLKPGEAAPENAGCNEAQAGEHFSQEELLRQPVHIPHRSLKDPREIRLLDPACGSMHFGLYAFDLFTVIYDEAWEIAHGPDEAAKSAESFAPFVTFAGPFPDKAAFLLEVPRLIIEHNIHGIDIDPRAAQIAGLSLWLRAQRAWHEAGIKPADRPPITRSNIVCAEPMPGEKKLLREFVEQQFDIGERPAFAFLLEKVFDQMTLAGEAGSLLRIEEEIRSVIAAANALARTQSIPKQVGLFPEDERPEPEQLDLQGLLDEHFWQRAEQRIYDALQTYAELAENDNGFQRRLFADDAAKGFAFIDICRKHYDAVVMNPPFGEFSKQWKDEARRGYPNCYNDILAAFVERFLFRLSPNGLLGAITSRTCFFLTTFKHWRSKVILENSAITTIADLGQGVMDQAMVEAAAYVLQRKATGQKLPIFRVIVDRDREQALKLCIDACREGHFEHRLFLVDQSSFNILSESPFVYWVGAETLEKFSHLPKFHKVVGEVRQGLATADNPRFVRTTWEVPPTECSDAIARKKWVPYVLAGPSQPWFSPITLYVNWHSEAGELWNNLNSKGTVRSNIWMLRDSIRLHFFQPGFSWTRRAVRFIPYIIPAGCIPSASRYMAFPQNGLLTESIAICASRIASAYLRFYGEKFEWPNFLVGTLRIFPWPTISATSRAHFESLIEREVQQRRRAYQNHEPFHDFLLPIKTRDFSNGGRALAFSLEGLLDEAGEKMAADLFGLTSEDIQVLERDLLEAIESQKGSSDNIAEISLEVEDEGEDNSDFVIDTTPIAAAGAHISYLVGCVFGRWDIRYGTGERQVPELPDPFAPLPACPPGMLQGDDGLPLLPEAGRKLRTEGNYPLDISWDGILVDDQEHPLDFERNIQCAFAVLWAERADALEHEACTLLGVPTLREWFRRPAGFFADHLKRYSKSRRQAPIYWPLSTAGGRYTLWLYYHRLTPDTLYKCLQQFVVPKLADVEKELTQLRTVLAANEGAAKDRSHLEELEGLRRELIELRTELELWAPKWKPNLNDGVLINAAPLWKLFRLPKWQKDLKACWQELENGDYNWAHLAYSLWPERVREKCKTDRSLAIAHGLEEICEVKPRVKKVKKSKTPKPEDDQQELPKD